MKLVAMGMIAVLTVSACAEVVSESKSTYRYRGQTLPVVVRTFQTENGSYSRRSIRFRGKFVTCSATDDRDCDAQLARSNLSSQDR